MSFIEPSVLMHYLWPCIMARPSPRCVRFTTRTHTCTHTLLLNFAEKRLRKRHGHPLPRHPHPSHPVRACPLLPVQVLSVCLSHWVLCWSAGLLIRLEQDEPWPSPTSSSLVFTQSLCSDGKPSRLSSSPLWLCILLQISPVWHNQFWPFLFYPLLLFFFFDE